MAMPYDVIGSAYSSQRRTDPRIAATLWKALGEARTILNVGAGAGSYEPADREVIAVDPSHVMLAQRAPAAGRSIRACAESLPFRDNSVDAVMAVLTIHHWCRQRQGILECVRVARHRVVILTWDPAAEGFWLARDYLPDLLALDRCIFPQILDIGEWLGTTSIIPVPIPADCIDGFLGAYWRRPAAYLDPDVRAGMSSFSRLSAIERPFDDLSKDLGSGKWLDRYGYLLEMDTLDLGYRLICGNIS